MEDFTRNVRPRVDAPVPGPVPPRDDDAWLPAMLEWSGQPVQWCRSEGKLNLNSQYALSVETYRRTGEWPLKWTCLSGQAQWYLFAVAAEQQHRQREQGFREVVEVSIHAPTELYSRRGECPQCGVTWRI